MTHERRVSHRAAKKLIAGAAALSGLLLAGCAGEPSSGDIEKAFRTKLETGTQAAAAVVGPEMAAQLKELTPELHALRKVSCKSGDDPKVYTCEVEIDMSAPLVGRKKQTVPMVLVKTSDGWRLPG